MAVLIHADVDVSAVVRRVRVLADTRYEGVARFVGIGGEHVAVVAYRQETAHETAPVVVFGAHVDTRSVRVRAVGIGGEGSTVGGIAAVGNLLYEFSRSCIGEHVHARGAPVGTLVVAVETGTAAWVAEVWSLVAGVVAADHDVAVLIARALVAT